MKKRLKLKDLVLHRVRCKCPLCLRHYIGDAMLDNLIPGTGTYVNPPLYRVICTKCTVARAAPELRTFPDLDDFDGPEAGD